MPLSDLQGRWSYVYALLTGVLGFTVLVSLCTQQTRPVDLATLLLFALIALIVSYFKIPIRPSHTAASQHGSPPLADLWAVELGLDGVILLGATLAGGAAFGGWTAFITGLITPFTSVYAAGDGHLFVLARHPRATHAPALHAAPDQGARKERRKIHLGRLLRDASWIDRAASALLNSGRNVIAVALAWAAYTGMGGRISPAAVDTPLAFALILLCATYAVVRTLWAWPAMILQSDHPRQALADLADPLAFLLELLPLPVALLVSTTFVRLGWSYLLLLALVFIGLGAVMRQMLETIRTMRGRVEALVFANQVKEAIADTPQEVGELCALAYSLCAQVAPATRFELGLYNDTLTQVHVQIVVDDTGRLPPMRIPPTPLWTWLSGREEPVLMNTDAQLAALPFVLPPLGQDRPPQAALFVPMLHVLSPRDGQKPGEGPASNGDGSAEPSSAPLVEAPAGSPIGGIVLQADRPGVFGKRALTSIAIIAEQVGLAIQRIRAS
jgi:hypothetical protein